MEGTKQNKLTSCYEPALRELNKQIAPLPLPHFLPSSLPPSLSYPPTLCPSLHPALLSSLPPSFTPSLSLPSLIISLPHCLISADL